MNIEVIKLKDYEEMPSNPRLDLKPGDPDYKKLDCSISEYGFLQPLIVNRSTKHIIAGHMRARILRERGI